ncbi:MAG: toprim domain-containing protein [Mesorhizobium sp.]|uniref:hypothetical protein n=1 Tax=Mesorhizobium sp. TaxID=1871066 RepID=UPI000FE4583F|nr:hypothetical protein [Mesorhizobium sp.]RWB40312.1 MAG: toprim domain-containing protein [Mesorhizobium sp.]RWB57879.1 MAG: toprim domain-containing protein [Mesorhizobium sp.]RWB82103.1 MAG: toprim domain-containing protein [Mesorhizobium sp.]RWD75835.1 MAG: toprim domain-containing protein [Mesorhizobium sp.]TIV89440.1 MAG: toprim domain-containing protein [Mesorhizobium sp.]
MDHFNESPSGEQHPVAKDVASVLRLQNANARQSSDEQKILEFLDAMRSAGVHMDTANSRGASHPIADGTVHRANAQGKKKARNQHVWYVLHLDTPASGAFGDLQTGIQDTWTEKRPSAMTAAERAELKKRMSETQRQREEERAALNAAAAAAAGHIMAATEKAPASHPYLAKKGLPPFPGLRRLKQNVKYTIEPDEDPRTARAGSLVVPLYTPGAELASVQLISDDGTKRFLKGTAKEGNYHPIGKRPEDPGAEFTIAIAEGYSTAARVHQATGYLTITAFDAGNLGPVSKAIRAKYPKARLLFAADNDRLVKMPDGRFNPGVTKAKEAAEAVSGLVAYPEFDDAEIELTDFDDLARKSGIDRVREIIDTVLLPSTAPIETELSAPTYADDFPEDHSVDGGYVGEVAPRALGHDNGTCYYWCPRRGQIATISMAGHSKQALLSMAPLAYWEFEFPVKNGCDWDAAANALLRQCENEGVFDPSRKVGRGVILDKARVVAHIGDRLVVDGIETDLNLANSQWIYQKRAPIKVGSLTALSMLETKRLDALLAKLSWVAPEMGRLFGGWLAIAPICGALTFRPHVWITGERGSGKSTVMDAIAGRLLESTSIRVQGDTTEAGVRQALKDDLLPILFDEFEAKTDDDRRRISKIIGLARQAFSSNGAPIIKGGAGGDSVAYRVRSAFLFASIDKSMTLPADDSRIVTLELRGPDPNANEAARRLRADSFAQLQKEMDVLLADDFSERFFMRSISLVSVINKNAETFARAIAKKTGKQRLGDTLAAPLAGWLSLHHDKSISEEAAAERVESWKWLGEAIDRGHTHADHDAAMTHLMQSPLILDGGVRRTVGEMIAKVVDGDVDFAATYHQALLRHGLRVELPEEPGAGAAILVSNTHPAIKAIFHGMPFHQATLKQHPAVKPNEKTVRFEGRDKVRCLRIDLEAYGESQDD